jgi:prephenate dehydrogenase
MKATLIGFGRFGKLFYQFFKDDYDFLIIDSDENKLNEIDERKNYQPFEINESEIIFLTVPISEIQNVARTISKKVSRNTLIVEMCSVKSYPLKVLTKYFPKNNVIGIHPLFGPDSVDSSLEGHQLIIVGENRSKKFKFFINKLKSKNLKLIKMTAQEHDKLMAYTLNLTQFIGRSLGKIKLPDNKIGTKGYFNLLDIVRRTNRDTYQLFVDMNKYNPYSKSMRKKVIQSFLETEKLLRKEL